MKQSTKNFQTALDLDGEMMTSSLPEDSHANLIAQQEKDLGKKTSDISGPKCSESFQKLSQPTSWAKMFVASLIGMGEWSSRKCALTWKILGTKYNRYYCQLVPSTRLIEEIGFGLLPTPTTIDIKPTKERFQKRIEYRESIGRKWVAGSLTEQIFHGMLPTPTAMDSTNATANMKSTQVKEGSMHSVTLSRAMAMGMLPTPQVSDANQPEKIEKFIKRQKYHAEKGVNLQFPLRMMMQMGMLPTPRASDEKMHWRTENWKGDDLGSEINHLLGTRSQLNPLFVAEMMGFPPDWTTLPFLNGETNPSKPTETP